MAEVEVGRTQLLEERQHGLLMDPQGDAKFRDTLVRTVGHLLLECSLDISYISPNIG